MSEIKSLTVLALCHKIENKEFSETPRKVNGFIGQIFRFAIASRLYNKLCMDKKEALQTLKQIVPIHRKLYTLVPGLNHHCEQRGFPENVKAVFTAYNGIFALFAIKNLFTKSGILSPRSPFLINL